MSSMNAEIPSTPESCTANAELKPVVRIMMVSNTGVVVLLNDTVIINRVFPIRHN